MNRLEKLAGDKHFSVIQKFVNYGPKKSLNVGAQFEKEATKSTSATSLSIPSSLESYLKDVADTGAAQFPWCKIKPLFRVKLEQVLLLSKRFII